LQKAKHAEFIWDHYFYDKKVVIIEIGAGTKYQAIRCISEDTLDKFGPKRSKLVRINPVRGLKSVYGEHAVKFID